MISHGNGPQIGLLALEEAAYEDAPDAPLDVLGAETQGMIGYLVEQELGNRLPFEKPLASLLTMIEVDPDDPAFADPTSRSARSTTRAEADVLAEKRGWAFKPDGDKMRRVVPSPVPKRIFEHRPIRWLLEHGCVVICAGGGGIPTAYRPGRQLVGVEAVIDKDHASGLLARDIDADILIMATDAPAAFVGFGTPHTRAIAQAHPDVLLDAYEDEFAAGSMLPKMIAACDFARATGKPAVIGALADIDAMLAGTAGTRVSTDVPGVVFGDGSVVVHSKEIVMPFGVHSEVGTLRKVMVHRPGLEHSRLTPSNAEELLFDDVLWVTRAKAEHDMFCEVMRERGVEVFLAETLLAEALVKPEAKDWVSDHILNERQVGITAAQRAHEWVETADAGAGRRVPDRRHHQGRRRTGRRVGVGVGRPDEHVVAAAAELLVPARSVVLDLRRRHDQPDDEAGPEARDDDHGGDLPLPPDVRGRAVPDLARRLRRGLGPRARRRRRRAADRQPAR